jgi:hypothetical protein
MATRTLTETRKNGSLYATNAVAIATNSTDDTSVLNVSGFRTMRAEVVVASSGGGNFALNAYGSQDGTNFTSLGATGTKTTDGTYPIITGQTQTNGSDNGILDIRNLNFIKFAKPAAVASDGTATVQAVFNATF